MRKSTAALLASLLLASGCSLSGKIAEEAPFSMTGTNWSAGFAALDLVPPESDLSTYFVAGYSGNNRATGLLDYQKVSAFWLDDHSGRGGVLFLSVDCVGLVRQEVMTIRKMLADFQRESGCRAVHVISTHTHAGIDTLGLWGPPAVDGKNADFMQLLRETAVQAAFAAYADRKDGQLFMGFADAAALQYDSRKPEVFDTRLSVFRFAPDDGSPGIRLVNFAAHAEALRGENSKISADFPAYMAQAVTKATNDRVLFAPGAIGGLIMTPRLQDAAGNEYPVEENVVKTGEALAEKLLAIDNERLLPPSLNMATEEFSVPLENPLYVMLQFLGVLTTETEKGGPFGLMVKTEVSLLELGRQKVLCIPGELFPELAYPGDDGSFAVHKTVENPPLLSEIVGDESVIIFGLTNDEIGYIVPPNNFLLHETAPYMDKPKDEFGENHYEETNSMGPETAKLLAQAVERLARRAGFAAAGQS